MLCGEAGEVALLAKSLLNKPEGVIWSPRIYIKKSLWCHMLLIPVQERWAQEGLWDSVVS